MKKTGLIFLIVIIVAAIAVGAFYYFGSYSEGTRAGTVVKVSKRGTLFKTYEGQLNMESFGAVDNKKQLNEIFEFSIDRNNDSIYNLLQEVALSGERVNLRYKEMFLAVPWRGDTKYFVNGVDRLDRSEKSKDKVKERLFD
ncbi:MAG: hypothetical protein WD048_00170 [Chitinophagales bacterium]